MRVRGDFAPSAAFTLEQQPDRPGYVLARFFENAREYKETREDQTTTGWEYDEYHLLLADSGGLDADIEAGYVSYLAQAKWSERDTDPDSLFDRLSTTEEQLAQADETAIGLFEAQAEQEEINAQQDEALLELYERTGI